MEFLVLFLFPHFLCAEGTWFQTGDRQFEKLHPSDGHRLLLCDLRDLCGECLEQHAQG